VSPLLQGGAGVRKAQVDHVTRHGRSGAYEEIRFAPVYVYRAVVLNHGGVVDRFDRGGTLLCFVNTGVPFKRLITGPLDTAIVVLRSLDVVFPEVVTPLYLDEYEV